MPTFYYFLYVVLVVWAIVDAIRRRAEPIWFFLILFLGPLGVLLYFVAGRSSGALPRSPRGGGWQPPASSVSLDELKRRVERVPSIQNLLDLGEGYLRRERFEEARSVFADVVARDPDSDRAAFGLAASLHALERYGEAVESVRPLVERQPAARNYEAWMLLGHSMVRAGRREEGLEELRRMARASAGLNQHLVYARVLAEDPTRRAEAAEELRQALAEFEFAPRFVQRRDRSVARAARKELARLQSGADGTNGRG